MKASMRVDIEVGTTADTKVKDRVEDMTVDLVKGMVVGTMLIMEADTTAVMIRGIIIFRKEKRGDPQVQLSQSHRGGAR